jgi:F-type H+-transporting ATPase subunit b
MFDWSNNFINWLIFVGLGVFLWTRIMPAVLAKRKDRIQTALDDASSTREEGKKFLVEQGRRIENAQKDADQILVDARKVAEELAQQMDEQTRKEAADLEHKITDQIEAHRQITITELRAHAAEVAMRLAEASVSGSITEEVKKGLEERFSAELDSIGKNQ